jgi:hypothetical protein
MSEIRNVTHLAQVLDFEGMKYERNIRPTNIDVPPVGMFLDFAGSLFIFAELKYGAIEDEHCMEAGQLAAFEKLCDTTENGGVKCYFLVASHNDSGERILVAKATVVVFRTNRMWHHPRSPLSIAEAVEKIKATPIPIEMAQRRALLSIETMQIKKTTKMNGGCSICGAVIDKPVCEVCMTVERGWQETTTKGGLAR